MIRGAWIVALFLAGGSPPALAQERGDSLVVAHQGRWRWVPPTRLENGNIATDLDYFAMYRQEPGHAPQVFAEIHDVSMAHEWSMGADEAGACFWFVAVRKPHTSPPMPSDKSNVVCLDDQGQPLPRT